MVAEEDAILASELFEGDWNEGANTAYYEDLGKLAVQLVMMVNPDSRSGYGMRALLAKKGATIELENHNHTSAAHPYI